MGARVIHSPRGRGAHLNAGADAATGDILLFLHADTWLPPDAADLIRRALGDPAALGGNFTLRFDAPGLLPRLFAAVYNARSRRSRLFYGDSALFMRRAAFDAVGGYKAGLDKATTGTLEGAGPRLDARRFHGKRGLA